MVYNDHIGRGRALRIEVGMSVLAILLLIGNASAIDVINATSADLGNFDLTIPSTRNYTGLTVNNSSLDKILLISDTSILSSNATNITNYSTNTGENIPIALTTEDSDGDGISDFNETNGFTWNGVTYYTDPFQKSTDFDPYNDYKEITTINMDPTVKAPGRHPLVPSYPDLKVDIGKITVNTLTKITSTKVLENYSTWDINTVTVDTTNENWGTNIEAKAGFSGWLFSPYAEVKASGYFDYAHTLTSTTISSTSGWNKEEWSMATAVDTDKAARLKYFLKIKNNGTDTAKNVHLKFNVKIGNNIIATITTSEIANRIDPDTVFPPDTFIVIDKDDSNNDITVTLNELRSIELGAPLTIEILEIFAQVPWENEPDKDWSDYKASIDRTSAKIVLDTGSEVKEYRVFSGIRYPASGNPYYFMNVTLENATLYTLGGEQREDGVYIGGEKVDNWRFGFDNSTFSEILTHLNKTNGSLLSIPIKQGWTIVMKPPDKEPPKIHWAVYTNDLKGIQASVSDNEKVVNVTAYVKVGNTYQKVILKDEDNDLIYNITLPEKITDVFGGYITADDGKFYSKLQISFIPNIIVDADLRDDPANHTWNTIQKGINNATAGDIVYVRNGTYRENIAIYKTLTLIGENNTNTIIDGNNKGHVVYVNANNVHISGFRVINGFAYDGIYLYYSNSCTLNNNLASNNSIGIFLSSSSNNTLSSNNLATNNRIGILLSSSSNNTLSSNNASNNYYGIYLGSSSNNVLSGNNASNNQDGISLFYSTKSLLKNNIMKENKRNLYQMEI